MNVIPTVGVLIFKNNKVLLVRHGEGASHITGMYGLPAGRIKLGEKKIQAARRELFEETGFVTEKEDLHELKLDIPHADIPRKDGTTKRFSITVFYCSHYSGELISSDETIPEWVSLENLDTIPLIGYTKRIIEEGYTIVVERFIAQ